MTSPINSVTGLTTATGVNGPFTPSPAPASGSGSSPQATAGAFVQDLTNAIGSLSGLENAADQSVAGVATNNGTDIHTAMIAMQQAQLGMSLATQVRDKAVEAYQTLMNMQM